MSLGAWSVVVGQHLGFVLITLHAGQWSLRLLMQAEAIVDNRNMSTAGSAGLEHHLGTPGHNAKQMRGIVSSTWHPNVLGASFRE